MMHRTGSRAGVAETAALAVDGPQPAWMTLNEARERAFTGEIVFETEPQVHAYLDNGIVYYAERASDVSLGRRLVDAGVVDIAQLERGTVRVGDVEHLGRLFDRDPSVDRDAVIVMAETSTEELVTELANRSTATVRCTAYRHHPSGVHRWFVAPVDPAMIPRPVSAVAQLDTTVVDELPGLSFTDGDAAELIIEWDDEFSDPTDVHTDVLELSFEFAEFTGDPRADAAVDDRAEVEFVVEPVDELIVQPVDEFDIDMFDELVVDDELDLETVETVEEEVVPDVDGKSDGDETSDGDDESGDDFEFAVVWPDGSAELATEATRFVEGSPTEGNLRFTMPPLELSDEPERADADVPDDVAEAVRRAIAVIESAGASAPHVAVGPESPARPPEIAEFDIFGEPETAAEQAATPRAVTDTPGGFGGFAPPTMATRAEVLYGQMDDLSTAVPGATHAEPSPSGEVAPVDEPVESGSSGGNERSSALRRLIGSLRRKDH